MTRITFLHGAADRHQAAAQWLTLAVRAERQVTVCLASNEQLDHFDRFLWTHSALDFIPHCRSGDPLEPDSPVVLTTQLDRNSAAPCVLNLTNAVPEGYENIDELVEIVSVDDGVRLPGRERFRFYREQGHPLENRDISSGVSA